MDIKDEVPSPLNAVFLPSSPWLAAPEHPDIGSISLPLSDPSPIPCTTSPRPSTGCDESGAEVPTKSCPWSLHVLVVISAASACRESPGTGIRVPLLETHGLTFIGLGREHLGKNGDEKCGPLPPGPLGEEAFCELIFYRESWVGERRLERYY